MHGFIDIDEKVAYSKQKAEFITRVQKPCPI